jgi:hypothetical protein
MTTQSVPLGIVLVGEPFGYPATMSRSIRELIEELAHVEDAMRHATLHSRQGGGSGTGLPALADLTRREKELVDELRQREESVPDTPSGPVVGQTGP